MSGWCLTPRRLILGAVASMVLMFPHVSPAQNQIVHVLGLKRWTRQMVEDSLAKYFTGDDARLDGHACAVNLGKLGFPRAAATYIGNVTLVTLVEPQDSALVPQRPVIRTTATMPADWASIMRLFVRAPNQLQVNPLRTLTRLYPMYARGAADSARERRRAAYVSDAQEGLWRFLDTHKRSEDRTSALAVLTGDSTVAHRAFAIAVLSQFLGDTAVRTALLQAIRDESDHIGMFAAAVLSDWARGAGPVDWTPWIPELRILLAGGNAWVMNEVFLMLALTKVDRTLAAQLLSGNATLVLDYAALPLERERLPAQLLLYTLSGEDHSHDVSRWRTWAAALHAPEQSVSHTP